MRQSLIQFRAVHLTAGLTFGLMTCREVDAVTTCLIVAEEDSGWQMIERMGTDQLIGMLLLVSFLVALAIVGLRCFARIASAVKQSRAYESRALTSLYFNRIDEAISAADSFPTSPVAAVVNASLQGTPSCSGPVSGVGSGSKPAFNRALIAQTQELRRGLWVPSAIGWSAPAIGLMTALCPSAIHSSGPPFPLLLGLAIAVPAIWLYRGLSSEVDLLLFETDRMSLSIVDQIAEQLDGAFENHHALGHHMPREIRLPIPPQDSRPLR
jgi:biopolymer transport protein ExbB/TolQ